MQDIIDREGLNSPFIVRTFSRQEREEMHGCPAEYFAAHFAVKEAVFKAVAQRLPEKGLEFRYVESSNHEDGSPYILLTEKMKEWMKLSGTDRFFLSISTEENIAAAFVIAEAD